MAASEFLQDPTEAEALALFKAVEEKFPSRTLGNDKWYVLAVCHIDMAHSTRLTLSVRRDGGRWRA